MKFRNRIGHENGKFGFDCYRAAEHPPNRPRFREFFTSKIERDRALTRHDAIHHDDLLRSRLALDADVPTLAEVIATSLKRYDRDWRKQLCDQKTVDYYVKIARRVLHHFSPDMAATQMTTKAILGYWDIRLDPQHREACSSCSKGSTLGEMVKKEIKGLGTMYRDAGIAPPWFLRRGALRGVKRPKTLKGVEKTARFIRAMGIGSIERDFCVFKFSTGIRNEEIYAANIGDEDLQNRVLEYRLRNKQGTLERHVTYLNDAALEIVARRVTGRACGKPIFEHKGRRLSASTCRKRFIAASKRATVAWRKESPSTAEEIMISSIGQFRHEVASAVKEQIELGGEGNALDIVKTQYGHRHEKTAEEHYLITNKAAKVSKSKTFTSHTDAVLQATLTKP